MGAARKNTSQKPLDCYGMDLSSPGSTTGSSCSFWEQSAGFLIKKKEVFYLRKELCKEVEVRTSMFWVSHVISSEQDAPNLFFWQFRGLWEEAAEFDTMNSCPRGHPGTALLQDELRLWIYGVWVPWVSHQHGWHHNKALCGFPSPTVCAFSRSWKCPSLPAILTWLLFFQTDEI